MCYVCNVFDGPDECGTCCHAVWNKNYKIYPNVSSNIGLNVCMTQCVTGKYKEYKGPKLPGGTYKK
jgi:hypothetical protein